jgi:hypothetical protein
MAIATDCCTCRECPAMDCPNISTMTIDQTNKSMTIGNVLKMPKISVAIVEVKSIYIRLWRPEGLYPIRAWISS